MKARLLTFVLLLFNCICFAQAPSKIAAAPVKKPSTQPVDLDLELYRKAITFGDYEVAKNALFNMIIKHPDSLSYMDSLVTLYFSLGQLSQCIFAGNQYLQQDTTNLGVMEM